MNKIKEKYPGWEYQPLFDLMSEHGLTLLQGEMDEIIECVKSLKISNNPDILGQNITD